MSQHRPDQSLHVVGDDEVTAVQQRGSLRQAEESDTAARRSPQRQGRGAARGPDQGGDVADQAVFHPDAPDRRAQLGQSLGVGHSLHAEARRLGCLESPQHPVKDALLRLVGGIAQQAFHQEAIQFRLWKWVGPLEFDRVLGGEDREALREWMRDAIHRDAPFLHRLQQRGLGLGRRAVDLVPQDQVAEQRPRPEGETTGPRQQVDAGDVARHQVRSELDAPEFQAERFAQGPNEQCLGGPRRAFEQNVASCQQRQDDLAQSSILPQHNPAELLEQPAGESRGGDDLIPAQWCSSSHRSSTASAARSTPAAGCPGRVRVTSVARA
ncbi:MAG: hypothetical protein E4H38_03420 [Gemmatimonadales bacterium]|nr:MAG: hypothetical protein E4H38_03420 [Gemmatimonadales bacterium]